MVSYDTSHCNRVGVGVGIVQRAADIDSTLVGGVYHCVLTPSADTANTEVAIGCVYRDISSYRDSALVDRILDHIIILGSRSSCVLLMVAYDTAHNQRSALHYLLIDDYIARVDSVDYWSSRTAISNNTTQM